MRFKREVNPTRRARVMKALAMAKLQGQPVQSGMNLLSFEQSDEPQGKFTKATPIAPKLTLWQRAVRFIKQLFKRK